MFKEIHKHKYLDVLAIKETENQELWIVIAELKVIEDSTPLTSDEEPNDTLRKIINESKPIGLTDSSCVYEILFENYITYSVVDESYAVSDPKAIYEGKFVGVYTESTFLDYVTNCTFATADYPGPFKHYGFYCENHVINIAAVNPPIVKRIMPKK